MYYAYNQTRETFLGMRISPADTAWKRLKGLMGKIKLGYDEGLWVRPSTGVHTIGVSFPVDVIYLDEQLHVVHLEEHLPAYSFAPMKTRAKSVLELPVHAIYSSQTQIGDKLEICGREEMLRRLSQQCAMRATG